MARELGVDKEDDMTECSVCTEVFTDPRVLPCIHTFCLKCLLNYGKDIPAGDDMPCPLCRKEFTIPDDGLSWIQKDFFMEKLLHARKLSVGKEASHILCDACDSDEASASESSKPVSMYCVQCQQYYCEQCSRSHTRMRVTAGHVQVEVGKQTKKEEIALKLPATCEIHKDETIKIFCLECKLAICKMCFVTSHKTHDCSDIEEVSVDFRQQMKIDTDNVSGLLKGTKDVLLRFEKRKNDSVNHFAVIKAKIKLDANKLIAAVHRDREKLLSEVESIKLKRIKQLETGKQEMEQHMAAMESFRRYSETLLSSGTACDVTRSANSLGLHDRADELMKFDVISHVDNSLPPLNIRFLSSTALDTDTGNLIGRVVDTDTTRSQPAVSHVIPKGNYVAGVASLGNDVFVVRYKNQHIEVYDDATFTLQRCLAVPELGQVSTGLAACSSNNCLYASDNGNSSVHRVDLSGSNAVMKWAVASRPVGLTVNKAHNLLVMSAGEHKLQEFKTNGELLQNIQLQACGGDPAQFVQMANGQFVVSCRGRWHGVWSVDKNGAAVRSYGGLYGSQTMTLKGPVGLAVDKHGNILVADAGNNRLLVLDSSLTNAHEMSVSVDGGLKDPISLCYDKSRGRLYIGEWLGRRVIVIDHLEDFSASQV